MDLDPVFKPEVVMVNFIARTKNSLEGFANLFFKIKICALVLFKKISLASLVSN